MSNNNEFMPSCAAECTDQVLLSFAEICASVAQVEPSEIQEIFISEIEDGVTKNPIGSWTLTGLAADDATNEAAILAWIAAHVAYTGTAKVRRVLGIGDKPEPTTDTVTVHAGIELTINPRHTMNFDVVVMNNLIYEALRSLEGCKGSYAVWFRTSKYFYGGRDGMVMNIQSAGYILDRGLGSISNYRFVFNWPANANPPRDAWPEAATGS